MNRGDYTYHAPSLKSNSGLWEWFHPFITFWYKLNEWLLFDCGQSYHIVLINYGKQKESSICKQWWELKKNIICSWLMTSTYNAKRVAYYNHEGCLEVLQTLAGGMSQMGSPSWHDKSSDECYVNEP